MVFRSRFPPASQRMHRRCALNQVVFCQATTALRAADASPSPVSPPGRRGRRVTCCPGRTVDGDPSSPFTSATFFSPLPALAVSSPEVKIFKARPAALFGGKIECCASSELGKPHRGFRLSEVKKLRPGDQAPPTLMRARL
ncbi:hypothetical protein MTO96_032442 [Rhipicephalus appendiculatus]